MELSEKVLENLSPDIFENAGVGKWNHSGLKSAKEKVHSEFLSKVNIEEVISTEKDGMDILIVKIIKKGSDELAGGVVWVNGDRTNLTPVMYEDTMEQFKNL